jgi:hypothetical protein
MKYKIIISYLVIFLILLAGCKHAEKVVIEKKVKPITVRRCVRMVYENELKYNTLSVRRVSLTINNDGDTKSVRGLYKIKKDSVIQVSAQKLTIPIGRLELNADSFKVVDHFDKLSFAGSIQNISDLIETDFIDYQTIQSILSNHIQSIKQDQKENPFRDYVLNITENMYKISSIRERRFNKFANNEQKLERFKQRNDDQHLVKQDIYIDPDIFVVRKEVYNDIDAGRIVTIEFSDFKALGKKWFPGKIHVGMSGKKKLDVDLELSKVTVNDETDFGFSVPSKYKREVIKQKYNLEHEVNEK